MAQGASLAAWASEFFGQYVSRDAVSIIAKVCEAGDDAEKDPLADAEHEDVLRACGMLDDSNGSSYSNGAEEKGQIEGLKARLAEWAALLQIPPPADPVAHSITALALSRDARRIDQERVALALLCATASPAVRRGIEEALAASSLEGKTGAAAGDKRLSQSSALRRTRTDRYGFFVHDSETAITREETPAEKRKRLQLENLRAEKWRVMCNNWERWRVRKGDKVKKRIRKGIPDSIRGFVWPRLVDAVDQVTERPYEHYVEMGVHHPNDETKPGGVIDRDLDRTFPRCQLFADRGGLGQTQLRNVLVAFASYRPDIGYFQGMNFFTALFLSFVPEDVAFGMLCRITLQGPHNMHAFFSRSRGSIKCLHHQLRELLRIKLPRLYRHFEAQGVDVAFFSTEWFVTVFSRSFPFGFVVHVWDIFLAEGWKIVFRVALTILKLSQATLLQHDMEGIMLHFRHLLQHIDVDSLVSAALKFPLKTAELDAVADAWEREQAT